jgi:hypothetical protein
MAIRSSRTLRRTQSRSARPIRSTATTCPCRTSAGAADGLSGALAERLRRRRRVRDPPTFASKAAGEQATMFLLDPAGNALEFKAMADPAKLFAKN